LLGFSDDAIDAYINIKANKVLDNLNLEPYFEEMDTPLLNLEKKYSLLQGDSKTNFFESTVGDYTVGQLDMEF